MIVRGRACRSCFLVSAHLLSAKVAEHMLLRENKLACLARTVSESQKRIGMEAAPTLFNNHVDIAFDEEFETTVEKTIDRKFIEMAGTTILGAFFYSFCSINLLSFKNIVTFFNSLCSL